jgi:hypothetical protein
MKTLLIVAITSVYTYALGANAQIPPPTADDKARQEMVKSATEGTAKGYGRADAEGSAAAAKTKAMPRMLPDQASKQQAVNSVTSQTVGKETGQVSAEGSAKAAADKTPRKPRPKMSDYERQLQKASTP